MTKKEGAIVTVYTGILIGKFSDAHEYMEKLLGRPIFIHELASKEIIQKLKDLSKEDFLEISIE